MENVEYHAIPLATKRDESEESQCPNDKLLSCKDARLRGTLGKLS